MSLIDKTYFVNDINIPITTFNDAVLTANITRWEPDLLRKVLGYDLSKLVMAYANPGSDQRIIDIVEGKEYSYDTDHLVNWQGLKNTALISPIAYYVYYRYVRSQLVLFQSSGATAQESEHGTRADASQLLSGAWYEMRELLGYPGQDVYAPSLYNFLMANVDDYPELEFTDIGMINSFGI